MVRPDIVQFHGSETPEWLSLVRQHTQAHIWKALGLKNRETLINVDRFDDVVDRVLYDAPAAGRFPGGTGTRVDWSLLQPSSNIAFLGGWRVAWRPTMSLKRCA